MTEEKKSVAVEGEHLAFILNVATALCQSTEEYCKEHNLSPADATLMMQAGSIMMIMDYRGQDAVVEDIIEQYNRGSVYLFGVIEKAEIDCEEGCEHGQEHGNNDKPN